MGLLFRPRTPLLRLAAGATTAAVAYNAGQRRAQQNVYNDQAEAAYAATQAPPAQAPAAAPVDPAVAELQRLSALHDAGQLTDAEFTAAKAKVLDL
jgi:hypothetical protein